MSFGRRYALRLLLPAAGIGLFLSLLFLTQVVQLQFDEWLSLAGAVLVIYGIGGVSFAIAAGKGAARFERALDSGGDVSGAMSRCLWVTEIAAAALWLGGGLLFGTFATLVYMRTFLGFEYFFEAALILAASAMGWSYWEAKRLLILAIPPERDIRYTGRRFSFAVKIAIVFIGFFIVAMGALVLLISSRVSTTLEELAITSNRPQFDQVLATAERELPLDDAKLETLQKSIPSNFSLILVPRGGSAVSTGPEPTEVEVDTIRRVRNGNSLRFIGPNVGSFRELADHSILMLSVPWKPYELIPLQVGFYGILIAIITTLIFTLATWLLSRDLSAPLRSISDLAARMAQGDFDGTQRIFSDDEVGALAESFEATRINLRTLIGRVGGSGTVITEGVRVITGGTDTLLLHAREQASLTESSTGALSNVRNGAQSVLMAADKVSESTQDSASRATEMQASAEEVAKNMDHLFNSVEKTSSSVNQMDASATEMSSRTEFLAQISEEVLAFVTEMDSTVEELRRTSETTSEISHQVREDATAGSDAVRETVEGAGVAQKSTERAAALLDELQKRIGQISQILTVIEEITDKTNLLALNAAIIAAQAGEHGAGFSVVADEIRQLAEKTRGSTKEIAGIIKTVQAGSQDAVRAMHEGLVQVNHNVEISERASQSLGKIQQSAESSYSMANKITTSLHEQAEASRHLHEVTSKMSDHIAEIHRSTREQATGARLLSEESERIREIALRVKEATHEQSVAGRGITLAMEAIASDFRTIRDLLQRQLVDTESIANASSTMLTIAQKNDAIAQEFNQTVRGLATSAGEFETEVKRFRITEH
ncbi:MAG: methyl-accepting chemotaxis protein [Thermoanaerobaculia bacterium]